jgi:hypothetical protein
MTLDDLHRAADRAFEMQGSAGTGCDTFGRIRARKAQDGGYEYFHWADHADRMHPVSKEFAEKHVA